MKNNLTLKPNQRRFLIKLIPYTAISLISGLMYFDIELGLLGTSANYPTTEIPYDSSASFIGTSIMSIILGLVLGSFEELLFKYRFKKFSFISKIFIKTVLYVLIVMLLIFGVSMALNAANLGVSIFDVNVVENVILFFSSFTLLSIIIYITFMIGICLFFTEIVDYLGLDVVTSFFTGKYSTSVTEDRIFMFLDMKSSTTIAEKIGHEKHYELINKYYADMTKPIIQTKGNIYQYVGDEIVIFWETKDGLDQGNCLKCFFLIKERIQKRAEGYQNRFGVVPSFKAGVHLGEVTRGQVGLIKRELLFTGDVLNTTARIQSLCNELESDLLVSEELKKSIHSNGFEFEEKGAFKLKGRDQQMKLLKVHTD
ncbi:MAG: adenylate/guanylate cyclase domain-containing protein [Bacteroidota bacterium]